MINTNTYPAKLCFGCEPLGGTDWGVVDLEEIGKAIRCALDHGVNFFDTAGVYGLGESERRLANILGDMRHEVIIGTKGGLSWEGGNPGLRARVYRDSSPSALRRDVEESLRRLRVETIPIYYVHWPDPKTDIRETFQFLSTLKAEGKIQNIGCSNFNALQLKTACRYADVSYIQLPINILGNSRIEASLENVISEHKIKVVAYNVLAYGLLTGKFTNQSSFAENDRRSRLAIFRGDDFKAVLKAVKDISLEAQKNNKTCAQYSIMKVLEMKHIVSVVLGIKSVKQFIENFSAISA